MPNLVLGRVEERTVFAVGAAAGSAVQEDHCGTVNYVYLRIRRLVGRQNAPGFPSLLPLNS